MNDTHDSTSTRRVPSRSSLTSLLGTLGVLLTVSGGLPLARTGYYQLTSRLPLPFKTFELIVLLGGAALTAIAVIRARR